MEFLAEYSSVIHRESLNSLEAAAIAAEDGQAVQPAPRAATRPAARGRGPHGQVFVRGVNDLCQYRRQPQPPPRPAQQSSSAMAKTARTGDKKVDLPDRKSTRLNSSH